MQLDLNQLVEDQLNLQVSLSYQEHHAFLLRHGLLDCKRVLDIGTGNGLFAKRLATDHEDIEFVGIDKRKNCIESCIRNQARNLRFEQVDMFSKNTLFDFGAFDGFLMRYFLLHVDHSHKIFDRLKAQVKKRSHVWVIDLDYSQISCMPSHPVFDKFLRLVKEFCLKKSIDSLAGNRVASLLEERGYECISVEHHPFTSTHLSPSELGTYLQQEALCYSAMVGGTMNDPETLEIVTFFEKEVKTGNVHVSYGMILISARCSGSE